MWKKYISPLVNKVTNAVKPMLGLGEDAAKAAKKMTPFDEAQDTSKMLKGMVDTGLSSTKAEEFAKHGMQVLNGPQSGNFAHDIAKTAAAAAKADPSSAHAKVLLSEAHKKLDHNISLRTKQAGMLHDPGELRALHTNNIRDARTMIQTGAPPALRDDAFKDIVRSLDSLQHTSPDVAKRLSHELGQDPAMRDGLTRAAKQIHEAEESARKAAAQAQAPRVGHAPTSTPATNPVDYGPDGNRDARLRNLGVKPEARPSEFTPPTHQYDERITQAQAQMPRTPTPQRPPQNDVELHALQQQRSALTSGQPAARITDMPVGDAQEISMDAFRKAEREANEAIARAAAPAAAEATKPAIVRTFTPTKMTP